LNDVYGFQRKSLAFNRFAQGSSQLFERLRGCGVRRTVDQGIEQWCLARTNKRDAMAQSLESLS
jgi:hypothetical protein